MSSKLHSKGLGVLWGILSAIFVAGYITTNKYIYGHYGITALQYSLVFAIVGGLFAFSSLLLQLNKNSIKSLKMHIGPLVLIGIVGATAVAMITTGQHFTTVVNASLLFTATIVSTLIFSHVFLGERLRRDQYFWTLVLFIGLYIGVVGFHPLHLLKGDLIILFSVIFFGFGNAYSRVVMKRMGSARMVPDVRLTVGGIIALILALFIIRDLALIWAILPLALLAGLFYWLTIKTFARAVFLINANNTIVLNNSQIFFTSLAGVFILSESYSWEKFIGSVVAIIAIFFIAGRNRIIKS